MMKQKPSAIGIFFLSLTGYLFIGYFLQRENFFVFISVYLLLFTGYVFVIGKEISDSQLKFWTVASIVFRVALLFSIPTLSDDYFRFIWDGKMFLSGINPYTIIPSHFISQQSSPDSYLQLLFSKMNSPDYFTIYPPVCQFIFGVAAFIFPDSISGSVMVIRLFVIAAELGSIVLIGKILKEFQLPKKNILLYSLNPLVIIELSGNLHPEALMVFFLLLAVYCLVKSKEKFSALAFSLAVASKLLPLMFLPFLIKRLKWRSAIYFLIVAAGCLLLFIPFVSRELINDASAGLELYFQKFEFNASIFYIVKFFCADVSQSLLVASAGPVLGAMVFAGVMVLVIFEKEISVKHFFNSIQWALMIYLLFATIVHPWYIVPLVMCAVFTGNKFPLLWSLMIALTYVTYQIEPYSENYWFVVLEYTIVFSVMAEEIFRSKRRENFQTIHH